MKSIFSKGSCIVALALAIPAFGTCAAVAVNGVCVSGNCVTPDAITSQGSTSGSTSNTLTINGDLFRVDTNFFCFLSVRNQLYRRSDRNLPRNRTLDT